MYILLNYLTKTNFVPMLCLKGNIVLADPIYDSVFYRFIWMHHEHPSFPKSSSMPSTGKLTLNIPDWMLSSSSSELGYKLEMKVPSKPI